MQKSTDQQADGLQKILQIQDYWLVNPSVQRAMFMVGFCLIPGTLLSTFIFGYGVFINIVLAICFGFILEVGLHQLRGNNLQTFSFDGSGAVMALIFALSLPPLLPWWILLIGITFSITLAKYAYGGTGNNIFNPAMAGVVALLISFPAEMNQWSIIIDGQSSATPLDSLQTSLRLSNMLSEIQNTGIFGSFASTGHEWINIGFLIGGLILIQKKIIRWHIPVGVLCGLVFFSVLFQISDADHYPGVFFHLFGGATMLCAFFVATDPVTSPSTKKGRFIYGFSIGIVIYVIRTWGAYPEGAAFAILMMNAASPVLDHFFRPQAPE
ncbi:MAG: RnfABCDGE type electron transport complex subunit D [Gammaproteobacteria bacterium]